MVNHEPEANQNMKQFRHLERYNELVTGVDLILGCEILTSLINLQPFLNPLITDNHRPNRA